jgi:coenzyme PQQ precursor peptide PqqA
MVGPNLDGARSQELQNQGNVDLGRNLLEAPSMSWITPTFVEIDMSAEIGSYQGDFDGL